MKIWIYLAISMVLCIGVAMADTGISQVPEAQDFTTQTTIITYGSFSQSSDIVLQITDALGGLDGIPPLDDSSKTGYIDVVSDDPLEEVAGGQNAGATYYQSVYSEDTRSGGTGTIGYVKALDLTTGDVTSGQSNIEATKRISYLGESGGQVLSDDYISVEGSANPSMSGRFGLGLNTSAPEPGPISTTGVYICPFSSGDGSFTPAFCSIVEASSAIAMTTADVVTTTDARFIMASADPGVELNHHIGVTDSVGDASAGMDVSVTEARAIEDMFPFNITMYDPNTGHEHDYVGWVGLGSTDASEELTYHTSTTASGILTKFDKSMSYTSGSS